MMDLDAGRRWESWMQLHEFSDVVGDKLFAIGKWRDQGSWVAGWLGGWEAGNSDADPLCVFKYRA
jgi:hypothetical protein